MSNSKNSQIRSIHIIEHDMIPNNSRVVFDWDNTLKVINKEKRTIESRLSASFLSHLKDDKLCELFIISAIRPSKMNLDTLLMEVDRLGLRQFFCDADDTTIKQRTLVDFPWMREGNIIICGYDKAEAFLSLTSTDQVDGVNIERPVVFFDDEEVNIHNFNAIVKGSQCFHVLND